MNSDHLSIIAALVFPAIPADKHRIENAIYQAKQLITAAEKAAEEDNAKGEPVELQEVSR